MEEGCSSVYAVSDELDESSLSSESELEVKLSSHPSVLQEDQLDQLSLALLERLKAPAASDLARKRKKRTYFLLIIAQY